MGLIYKCIRDLHPFKKGQNYTFERIEYCLHRWKEVQYKCRSIEGTKDIISISINEKPFKKHFINLSIKKENHLVKLLGI